MKCLDLFCGAGGASMGIHRAGFQVSGVDINPQPNYPFKFQQGDALDACLDDFDFIWASPPCQKHSLLRHRTGSNYECLIERTREKILDSGKTYIIENVVGAPLLNPVMLCGSFFGLNIRRHRIFESNIPIVGSECRHCDFPEPIDVTGTGGRRLGSRTDGKGGNSRKPKNLREAREVMQIYWMSRKEISQAIPPAYSEFLARQVLKFISH